MRISRPCYDKAWRCPGWAGGGLRYAKRNRCDAGSLAKAIDWDRRWTWHTHRCPACGVLVLPSNIRLIDPTWWLHSLRVYWRDFAYWWQHESPWAR